MPDSSTTLADLRTLIADFVRERDWNQFHSPKNLSMSLAIEAAELMEHFQWLTIDESRAIAQQPEKLGEVSDELADVLCYALALANELSIDVSSAIRAKMIKNEQKYPAERNSRPLWARCPQNVNRMLSALLDQILRCLIDAALLNQHRRGQFGDAGVSAPIRAHRQRNPAIGNRTLRNRQVGQLRLAGDQFGHQLDGTLGRQQFGKDAAEQ